MPLKAADDKSKRVKLLEDLQRVPSLSFSQKDWLRNELSNLKKGIAGERDAAYYIDHYFDKGGNHVVLHDLRFVMDGEVTQIDHLVMARGGNIYLLETKNFRDLAEGAVMEREGAGHPLIWSACALLSNAGYAALDEARDSGMLLYAWCGTTFFDQPTARH